LFNSWQFWLQTLQSQQFKGGWRSQGYTVLGWGIVKPASSSQQLLHCYYSEQLNLQKFTQLRHQLSQKLSSSLEKLRLKAKLFQDRLEDSDQAELHRAQADLLMAHLQAWQPGMQAIVVPDFDTGSPITIRLNPEKNVIQNAQAFYRQHQKLKRARIAVEPLLAEVNQEIHYLEQVEAAIYQLELDQGNKDLVALEEIQDELIQQQYLAEPEYRSPVNPTTGFHHYHTPSGFELLVGRNNRQNDQLTFRFAGSYDLWFHTQEIPGSHLLLRLEPGAVPEQADLQFAADFAAYYSRSRQSQQVPVIYTQPKYVYKPKGAKPGMALYKHEQLIWGHPQAAHQYLTQQS
ncbi:MAG TPA: NFACT family protein, partial [Candidatus Caenarcaniphilales bacterium]